MVMARVEIRLSGEEIGDAARVASGAPKGVRNAQTQAPATATIDPHRKPPELDRKTNKTKMPTCRKGKSRQNSPRGPWPQSCRRGTLQRPFAWANTKDRTSPREHRPSQARYDGDQGWAETFPRSSPPGPETPLLPARRTYFHHSLGRASPRLGINFTSQQPFGVGDTIVAGERTCFHHSLG